MADKNSEIFQTARYKQNGVSIVIQFSESV